MSLAGQDCLGFHEKQRALLKTVHQGAVDDSGYLTQIIRICWRIEVLMGSELACRPDGNPGIIDLGRILFEIEL